jgi:hypothetical protein
MGVHLVSQEKGDACYGGMPPFYLTLQKRLSIEYSPWDAPCHSIQHACWGTYAQVCVPTGMQRARCKKHRVEHKLFEIFKPLD